MVVGTADIAYMVYCVANGSSYASSLNIFALIGGVLLYRGSLRAARTCARFAALALGALLAAPFVFPLVYPTRLALATAKAEPASGLLSAVWFLALAALSFWVYRQLTSEAVTSAFDRPLRAGWAVAGGALLVAFIAIVVASMLRGPAADRVLSEARQELGPDYDYFVTRMVTTTGADGGSVRAVVLAYNSERIEPIQVKCDGADGSARCTSRWRGSAKREPESAETDSPTEAETGPAPEPSDPLAQARESLRKGELQAAVAGYGAVLERDPSSTEAYYGRGVAFTRLGEREQALKDFDSCIVRGDGNIDVYLQADALLAQRGEWSRIVDNWTLFIDKNPGSGRAYYERGGALLHAGETERALRDAEESCKLGYQPGCQALERHTSHR
jgi:tetratricopeptide (TPR) repeat protein